MSKSESKYFNTALRMDEALIALLEEKDLEYITVKEICHLAGVNRSTFYLHYATLSKSSSAVRMALITRWLTSLMPRKRVRSWTRWASTAEKNTGNLCWSLRQRWNRRSQRWKRRRCDRPDNALLARCAPLWGVLLPSWHPYPSTGLKRRVRALCRCADRDSSQP